MADLTHLTSCLCRQDDSGKIHGPNDDNCKGLWEYMNELGIVVIGRNEGERLRLCLQSLPPAVPVVYVDSGSTDGSVSLALSMGAEVVELDQTRPFSAARARNAGTDRLVALHPESGFVQFIDGDCTLIAGWLEAGVAALRSEPARAAVIGHLVERHRDATPYNRLCALEWQSPPGDLKDFGALGGISMMRIEVLRKLGGFNPDVIAGEDSELGARIALAGYKVTKVDRPMATHDAAIVSFGQWWKRSVRAGHAIGQRSHLNGATALRDCVRERTSTWLWGIGLPALVLVTSIPTRGLSLLLLAAYVLLFYRVLRFRLKRGNSLGDAIFYARYLLLAKLANGVGLVKFYLNRLARRYEIIEYK